MLPGMSWVAAEPWLATIGMVAAAALICVPLQTIILPANLSLIFLPAVLFSALRYGLFPSILASLLGELVWNFFFLPPRFSFTIDDPQDFLAFVLALIVSLVVSNLAASEKRQRETVRARAEATGRLYAFSQEIAAIASLDTLLAVACKAIGAMLDCGVAIAHKSADGQELRAAWPAMEQTDEDLLAVMANASGGVPDDPDGGAAGRWRTTGRYNAIELDGLSAGTGLIGITRSPNAIPADDLVLLRTLTNQVTIAIERLQLTRSVEQASLEAQREHLRSAMLTSLSHDLRTPLTVIIATYSALRTLHDPADRTLREELLDRAQAEAERLNRFIGNLLDMTRLEAGKLNVRLGPVDVSDAIESALARAAPLLAEHELDIDLPPDLPMAEADFLLLEQVIFNLLDNAAKYAPPPSAIRISASAYATGMMIDVIDEGPGIPKASRLAIFDKFTRLDQEDRQPPGTGLGLAISRGFLSAMGGRISARDRADRSGAIFTIGLGIADLSSAAPANPGRRETG
jgi:two-component system sensor histidine kinase KdpD